MGRYTIASVSCGKDSLVIPYEYIKLGVYVLANYGDGETPEEKVGNALRRINALRGLGYDPYVMIYDKPNAPREIRLLQRWCNNRLIFRSEPDFYKYDPKRGHKKLERS